MNNRTRVIADLAFLLVVFLAFPGCGMTGSDRAARSQTSGQGLRTFLGVGRIANISFSDFYIKLLEEGKNWAGDHLYISKISVGPDGGADRRDAAAPVWTAQLVRCDREDETDGEPDRPKIMLCVGESRSAVMANAAIGGYDYGFSLGKEEIFYGSAVKPERIKIAAAEAQRLADHARGGGSGGNYVYELTVDRTDNLPIWRISRICPVGAVTPGSCLDSDRWSVEINAETGAVLDRAPAVE